MNPPETQELELTCPMCLQLFSQPISLPCGHTYCLPCLQTLGEGLDRSSCPECQAEYDGTAALVENIKLSSMVETYKANIGKTGSTADPSGVVQTEPRDQVVSDPDALNSGCDQNVAAAGGSQECEGSDGSQEVPFPPDQEESGDKGRMRLDEPKFRLASQVTELNLKLEMAEDVLKTEKELESEVITANDHLRQKVSKLLEQIQDHSQRYAAEVTQMIEEELGPGEAAITARVGQASELRQQLRRAMLRAKSMLTEDDEAAFYDELENLEPHIAELLARPVGEQEDHMVPRVNLAGVCPKLDNMNSDLREQLGEIQRSVRNALNPSEVTFDLETAHPNLVLSEDLKTVTFSLKKQPYPSSPHRFTSFLQVLSTQSFSEGDHSWGVELDGSPWIVGLCYGGRLARSGLTSAIERSSWCLMWFNNMLTAFDQGREVPLRKTPEAHRMLEIQLSFKSHSLSFYIISAIRGKTHVYTFKTVLTEPVHLAYRMLTGQPKARVSVSS